MREVGGLPIWEFTKDEYDKKLQDLKDRQYRLNLELDEHTKADHEYHIHVSTVINLCRRIRIIFEGSEVSEKHAILNFVLSNLSVTDRKLKYSLRKPFDAVLDLALSSNLAPRPGLEPGTIALTGRRSTIELSRNTNTILADIQKFQWRNQNRFFQSDWRQLDGQLPPGFCATSNKIFATPPVVRMTGNVLGGEGEDDRLGAVRFARRPVAAAGIGKGELRRDGRGKVALLVGDHPQVQWHTFG